MKIYKISNKRDCLIFPIGTYDNPNHKNRSNALKDADRLKETFEGLNFDCQETYKNRISTSYRLYTYHIIFKIV